MDSLPNNSHSSLRFFSATANFVSSLNNTQIILIFSDKLEPFAIECNSLESILFEKTLNEVQQGNSIRYI